MPSVQQNDAHPSLLIHHTYDANLRNADLRGASLMMTQVEEANFEGADMCDIPWLFIMELTLQLRTNFAEIQCDGPDD
jgi:uncharacterized protein YjbI with pentapeptide repeats